MNYEDVKKLREDSKRINQECMEKVYAQCDGVNQDGWKIRGSLGKPSPCWNCGISRWDDGCKCPNCGARFRRGLN